VISRTIHSFILSLLLSIPLEGKHVELRTDKSVYVAGDMILLSALCLKGDVINEDSSIAYVELISSDGLAATAKIALVSGRGAGYLRLPASIPTGNYGICAYTKDSDKAEVRIISIFNAKSTARVKDGVIISDSVSLTPQNSTRIAPSIIFNSVKYGGCHHISIRNKQDKRVSVIVSVCEDDGLRAPSSSAGFVNLEPGEPEYDGEIVEARILGPDARAVLNRPWLTAIISSPGSPADTYSGEINNDGTIRFKTNNIYGDKDLVCEVLGIEDEHMNCHFAPLSPFTNIQCPELPPLKISARMQQAIISRHNAAVIHASDTLYEFLPFRQPLLLSDGDCRHWHLDDYTRFNTVEEIITELVPIAGIRNVNGKKRIKLAVSDKTKKLKSDDVLIMLDGVPVSDHERLLSFDALSLGDMYIYPYIYVIGKAVFNGIINFVTTKHDMSALEFDDNVRILDYQGCSYPIALHMKGGLQKSAGSTLLWEPCLTLDPGECVEYSVPADGSPLNITIEDVSSDGEEFHEVKNSPELLPLLYRGRVAKKYDNYYNGTPYYDTTSFLNASVMYNGRLYEDVLLRYDACENKLELRRDYEMSPTYPDENHVSWFRRDGRLFVNLRYQGVDAPSGFFELESAGEPMVFSKTWKVMVTKNLENHNGRAIGYHDPNYNETFPDYYEYHQNWWILQDSRLKAVKERKARRLIKSSSGRNDSEISSLKKWSDVDSLVSRHFIMPISAAGAEFIDAMPDGYFSETPEVTYGVESTEARYKNKVYIIGAGNPAGANEDIRLSGFILDEEGAPLPGTVVFTEGSDSYIRAGKDGSYAIVLKQGEYDLYFSHPEKEAQSLHVTLLGEGKLNVVVHDRSTMLDAATITAESMRNHHSTMMGVERITTKNITKIPTVFGEKDIMRVLLSLPGVETVGEASAGFNVRGGTNDQNLILFNGNTIYYPSHFFGINSVFNPDIVESAELFKSNFPAGYGGRASSVLDIRSKDGNVKKVKGSMSLGVITSRISIDGPVLRSKKTSFSLAARSTYSDWIMRRLPQNSDFHGGSADFRDFNLGVTHHADSSSTLRLFAYASMDHFSTDSLNRFSYSNANASIHWDHRGDNTDYSLSAGYDRYGSIVEQGLNIYELFKLNTSVNQFFARGNLEWRLGDNHRLSYGGEALYYCLQRGHRRPLGEKSNIIAADLAPDQAFQPSVFVSDIWTPHDSLAVEGAVRIMGLMRGDAGYVNPELRLSGRWSPAPTLSFKFGVNTVTQYIHLLTNTAVISPLDTWKLSDANIKPTTGWQVSSGAYWTIDGGKLDLSAELYYKHLRYFYDSVTGAELVMNDNLHDELVPTKNRSFGIELMARRSVGHLTGWASYTYSRSFLRDMGRRSILINDGDWYRSPTDKPHSFKLCCNYAFTHRYSISMNIDYSTGRPVTLPDAAFEYGGGSRLYYSSRNGYRIPDYFRIDLAVNIDPGHYLKAPVHASFTLGCYNLNARRNAYSVYYKSVGSHFGEGRKLSIFAVPVPYANLNILF